MIKLKDILFEGKIKPKQKISKKEWGKIKKFNKHIGQDGTHYVMQLDKRLGTILVPVLVEGKLNEFNKAHFLDLIKQEIESLKGQIEYAKKVLSGRYGSVEDWEKKEIKAVLKDNIKDLKATTKRYKFVQSMKEGKLNEGKVVRLPSGHKVKVEFKGLTFSATRGKDVFLDRTELQRFFKATRKYLYK